MNSIKERIINLWREFNRQEAEALTVRVPRTEINALIAILPMGDMGIKGQVGGSHYAAKAIQPIDYIQANALGFCAGNVVKYVSRYKDKGGKEDLLKARHYIDLLIAHEYPEVTAKVDSEK